MTTQAYSVLLSRLQRVSKVPPATHKGIVRAAKACCPVHNDRNPSLSVSLTADGRVLVHCYGCAAPAAEIMAAVGLTLADAAPDKPAGPAGLPPVDRHGPAAWASVQAAVDATAEAVIEAVIAGTDEAMWRALDALDAMRKAAKAAMRQDARRRGAGRVEREEGKLCSV